MISRSFALVMAGMLLSMSAGCARPEPVRVQLTGRILLDDKPLDDAIVQFWETSEAQEPYGSSCKSNEDGVFEMSAGGLKPGRYIVRVMETRIRNPRIPEIYGLCETSPLLHEVRTDDTDMGTIRLERSRADKDRPSQKDGTPKE